jgi:glycosyltransferase involved in cell wall biosynthesis
MILQVITDNDRRGGQIFATDLEASIRERGREIRTLALAPASGRSALDHEVLGPSRRHPATMRALRREMRKASMVIAHGSTTLPMCALASGLGGVAPFVYRQISEQRFWVNTPARHIRTRWALGRAAHVVALWQGAADTLSHDFGVDRSLITIVPNGVPSDRCPGLNTRERPAARTRFGLAPDRPTLLSIGALAPEKGVDILIKAMREPVLAGWQLLVVGRGPERARLARQAGDLPSGTVVFHGPVASAADAVAAADVVGLTSRGGDSMPAVLIEAGMMGLPVVATPVEGIVDIVRDGETGLLVPAEDPAAAATAVAEARIRARDLGAAASRYCLDTFEIGKVAEQWLAVVDRTAEMHQRPPGEG